MLTKINDSWSAMVDTDSFRIFPKGRDGKTRPVRIIRTDIILKHASGDEVRFRRHLHQKQWKWSDSRVKGPVSQDYVQTEVARMLFAGDAAKSGDFLIRAIMMGA